MYIVRHKNWAYYYKQEQEVPPQWGAPSPLRVAQLDKPYVGAVTFSGEATDARVPAQAISVSGSAISCARLATVLQTEANWTVHVAPSVSARRVHVFGQKMNPSALLEAVAYLVNAAEEVKLKPTDAQLAAENYDSLRLPDFIRERLGPSDALRADVEKLLTKGQQTDLQNGKYIAISVSSLPPGLQQRALNYINLSAALNDNLVATPDTSKSNNFQIRFLPESSGTLSRMLGVVTVAADGHEYFF